GRKRAATLVVDENVLEAEHAHGLVERQQLKAAHAEHRAGFGDAQHLGERLAAVELARGVRGDVVHCAISFTRAATSRATSSTAGMPISQPRRPPAPCTAAALPPPITLHPPPLPPPPHP